MMSEEMNIPYDAQQLAEEIELGDRQATNVNPEKEYEQAQQYATSNPDAPTEADLDEVNSPGNPEQFMDMARSLQSTENS